MKLVYKVFLVIFIVSLIASILGIKWEESLSSEENIKFLVPICASVVGLLFVLILHQLSKLSKK